MIDLPTYLRQRSPRFGNQNPTRMDIPFWLHMVRTGKTAYHGSREFDPPEGEAPQPVWCFNRFGPTRTPLADGRIICIGGEHEDFYDPDFCIYNDVVVVGPGEVLSIYGYPREIFPPTDFHTATLCGGRILIVGGLGYGDKRGGLKPDEKRSHLGTPVFSLDLKTYAITHLFPSGPSPGWISEHQARLVDRGRALRVWGGEIFEDEGRKESLVPNTKAADLVLESLTWQPAEAPPDLDAAPEIEWPHPWQSVGDEKFILNNLRREVPLGHPLFAINVRPWAERDIEEKFCLKCWMGQGVWPKSCWKRRICLVGMQHSPSRPRFFIKVLSSGCGQPSRPPDSFHGRGGRIYPLGIEAPSQFPSSGLYFAAYNEVA